jgi:hypothetical protein
MKHKPTTNLTRTVGLASMGVAAFIATLSSAPLCAADPAFKLGAGVQTVNARSGHPDNILPPGFSLRLIAHGEDPIENPSGVITQFGFLSTGVRTEPDENTYLVLDHNPGGPTAGYDYGRHFLFQGHENGGNLAFLTRINLDVTDPAHRITLLTPVGTDGLTHFNSIDGSTWNPHTKTLLFTQEAGSSGGVIEISPEWGSTARTLDGILGRAGYEGIHPDNRGNLIIMEDAGGTGVSIDPNNPNGTTKTARLPNSFVYRFVPSNPSDLSAGGKLQALQVSINGQPVQFVPIDANHPFGDVFSDNQLKLHTPGTSWPVKWVTVHDTDTDGTAPFDANAAAKKAGATPFKRPENSQFLPGSGFNTFFFDATGDTDATAGNVPALAARGSWGSIFRVDFKNEDHRENNDDSKSASGKISIFVLGDQFHAGFDNVTFVDERTLLAAEDRGDTLHAQLNMLDSVWAYDVRKPKSQGVRFIALGRDSQSEVAGEDNEPTGLHASDGDPTVGGIIGKPTHPEDRRLFFTEQHGDNQVWEIQGNAEDNPKTGHGK